MLTQSIMSNVCSTSERQRFMRKITSYLMNTRNNTRNQDTQVQNHGAFACVHVKLGRMKKKRTLEIDLNVNVNAIKAVVVDGKVKHIVYLLHLKCSNEVVCLLQSRTIKQANIQQFPIIPHWHSTCALNAQELSKPNEDVFLFWHPRSCRFFFVALFNLARKKLTHTHWTLSLFVLLFQRNAFGHSTYIYILNLLIRRKCDVWNVNIYICIFLCECAREYYANKKPSKPNRSDPKRWLWRQCVVKPCCEW